MDKTKILRLCNEIEDIAIEIQERTMKDSYFMAQQIINKVLVIGAEISAPPKTNADRIRQLTDEELAYFMVTQAIMGAIYANDISDKAVADKIVKEIIMEHKADEDIFAALIWTKQEVSEDAETVSD